MPDQTEPAAPQADDTLDSAIREVNARITEEVLNLRARLLTLEQELETIKRAAPEDGAGEVEPAADEPRRGKRERRPKRERRAKEGRAKREGREKVAGARAGKARKRQAAEDPSDSEDE